MTTTMTPQEAYFQARREGPSDASRILACLSPGWAYAYAQDVDGQLRSDTLNACLGSPEFSFWYARNIKNAPIDLLRSAACRDPGWAYQFALLVDKAPRDDTRMAAGQDELAANRYARTIDRYPHPALTAKWGDKLDQNPAVYAALDLSVPGAGDDTDDDDDDGDDDDDDGDDINESAIAASLLNKLV